MRFVIFLTIFGLILSLGHSYVGLRLARPFAKGTRTRRGVLFGAGMLALLPFLAFATRVSGAEGALIDVMSWVGFSSLGLSSMLLCFVVFVDLVGLAQRAIAKVRSALDDEAEPDLQRRSLVASSLTFGQMGGSAFLAGIGMAEARDEPKVVEVQVPVDGLPASLEGLRIVQLTDVHIGPTIKGDFAERVAARAESLKPDLVAITGDLVDGSVRYLSAHVAPLAKIASRYGVYFVTGNHEYYSGVESWVKELRRLGMRVLTNAHELVEHDGGRVLVAGVNDFRANNVYPGHTSSVADALAGAPERDFTLLLAHQPRSIHEAARKGVDLQLSGHTHGGQFFPWTFFAALAQPYVSGLHRHAGKSWIYVSRGTGYWGPPLRLAAPHEITLLVLRRARGVAAR